MRNVPHSAPHGYSPFPLLKAPAIAGLLPARVPEPRHFTIEGAELDLLPGDKRRALLEAADKLLHTAIHALTKGNQVDLTEAALDFDTHLMGLCRTPPVITTSVMMNNERYRETTALPRIPTKEAMDAEIDEILDNMVDGMAERYAAFQAQQQAKYGNRTKAKDAENHDA